MSKQPDFLAKPDGRISESDVEDLCIAVSTLRDSNGLLLALKPADVFQDWFLDAIRPEIPENTPDLIKQTHIRLWGEKK
jgi:hypothetical protein